MGIGHWVLHIPLFPVPLLYERQGKRDGVLVVCQFYFDGCVQIHNPLTDVALLRLYNPIRLVLASKTLNCVGWVEERNPTFSGGLLGFTSFNPTYNYP
ncbi:hypothetical protein [[Scytonema hofmanni] UTEX B 1581]|uniref:hypothetical protein n=1 Tax=[Scytonema hofmanni] UTEX B 1581 TaxID=379535 RepID=UPI0004B84A01|nr:hypothetical protein [[Scytonema hofmanni] UTEX B 1581]